MIIRDLTNYLESIAPLHLQEAYDNAGLIIGQEDWEIKGVLTTLDATSKVVEEAIARRCNVIVAHHPIIFNGLKQINADHYIGRAVIKAIQNDIAIYAIHTNLDNVLSDGVNQKIGDLLGLESQEILMPRDEANPQIGSGLIGELRHVLTMEDFIQHVKKSLDLSIVKHTPYVKNEVSKIGLCGGSGRFLLERAISERADVFISADFKYHEYFEANSQICVLDIGHYESERHTKELLLDLIQRKFSNFAAYCSEVNTNPINYK